MPAYFRVHIDGSWPAAGEVFSTSFATTAPDVPPSQAVLTAWAQAAFDYIKANGATAQALMGSIGLTGQVDVVRVYWYPSTSGAASLSAVSTGVPAQGSGSVTTPPQICQVWTLLTGIPGRSFRGRMYWPKVTGAVTSSFRDSGANSSRASFIAAFLNGLVAAANLGTPIEPAVVSKTRDLVTPVTQVQVGDVLDTQRRRRDGLQEVRYSATV